MGEMNSLSESEIREFEKLAEESVSEGQFDQAISYFEAAHRGWVSLYLDKLEDSVDIIWVRLKLGLCAHSYGKLLEKLDRLDLALGYLSQPGKLGMPFAISDVNRVLQRLGRQNEISQGRPGGGPIARREAKDSMEAEARHHISKGDFDKAAEVYRHLIRRHHFSFIDALAELLTVQVEKEIDEFRKLERNTLISEALDALWETRGPNPEPLLMRLVKLGSMDAAVRLGVGVLDNNGDKQLAEHYFNLAHQAGILSGTRNLAWLAHKRGDVNLAESLYRKLYYANDLSGASDLADLLEARGAFDEADEIRREIVGRSDWLD